MMRERLRNVALAACLALGLIGFGVHHLVSASDRTEKARDADRTAVEKPSADDRAAADEAKPGPAVRRREAVIRLPVGTFVKEVDVDPYGHGRIAWTYEDERVLGHIEGSVMGFQFDVTTQSEYSLSSDGTIYGILTAVQLNQVRLPESEEFAKLRPYLALWNAAEPVIDEMVIDVPFSYRFRLQGDRLVISNFRMLLAGPNPLGKLGGLVAASGNDQGLAFLAYFQALGTAVEGTYTVGVPTEKREMEPRRSPLKFGRRLGVKARR